MLVLVSGTCYMWAQQHDCVHHSLHCSMHNSKRCVAICSIDAWCDGLSNVNRPIILDSSAEWQVLFFALLQCHAIDNPSPIEFSANLYGVRATVRSRDVAS